MDELFSAPGLRAILRFSVTANSASELEAWSSGQPIDAQEEPKLDPNNPRLRRLVEAIVFSRHFILSYYIVVAAVIALFAVRHWSRKYKWPQSACENINVESEDVDRSVSSSSSSTLQGTESPPDKSSSKKSLDENTPLLVDKEDVSPKTFLYRLRQHTRSLLLHQPSPIPSLTSSSNHLPRNETSLLILLLLGVNIFYLFYKTSISIPMLFALADRAGLCFVANIPVLYILAAKTNQPIRFLTGWSYEGLNIFHRRLGEWMIILATIHTVGMFGVWYTLLRLLNFTLLKFLSSRLVLLGIFAFTAYLLIYITSTGYFRQLYYETFLGLHMLLQVAALVLLFFHHHSARPYVIASFAIWALDRILLRLIITTRRFVADLQIAEDGETLLLFCNIPIERSLSRSLDIRSGWQAGEHVFVTIPGMGWHHRLQAHPFSIASPAPPAGFNSGEWPLQLIIRAKDGFSKDLLTYSKYHQHTKILLDGPYGGNEALSLLRFADRKCLIAGGSGIAVTYSLAWDLRIKGGSHDAPISTRTVYRNGRKNAPNITQVPSDSTEDFTHFWIKSSPMHQEWISILPKLSYLHPKILPPISSPETETHYTSNLVTEGFNTQDNSHSERPDMKWLLSNWVESSDQKGENRKDRSICVVVSGPDGLVRDVQNTAAELVKAGWRIEVVVEKFGW